jgi:hypothetical protein
VKLPAENKVPVVPDFVLTVVRNAPAIVLVALILNAVAVVEIVPVPAEPAPPPDDVAALNDGAGRVELE